MPKTFAFLLIGLFFGTGFGFVVVASSGAEQTGNDHGGADAVLDDSAREAGKGDYAGLKHAASTAAGTPAPVILLTPNGDGPQSRGLHIGVSDLTFDPQGVNGPHVPGRGHAHLHGNDVSIARACFPSCHLSALPKGASEFRVTLSANTHSQRASDALPIQAVIRRTIA